MTALELIGFLNQALFVGLFVVVLAHAVREPSRPTMNTALLFGSVATVIAVSRIADVAGFEDHPALPGVLTTLFLVTPLAMIRLVDDFSDSPRALQVAGFVGFAGISTAALVASGPIERVVAAAAIAYFLAVGGYAAVAFAREAGRTRGITQRRMAAVAAGTVAFVTAIVLVFSGVVEPDAAEVTGLLAQVTAFLAAIAFFLGFAPPAWVRRAWREPDLRHFLERSIHLSGVADERRAVAELNRAAARAFGATGASIGLADPERGVIRYVAAATGEWVEYPDDELIGGRAYREGRRIVAADAVTDDPDHADVYRNARARAIIAAPISNETRRLGVLAIYAERMSMFVEDDIWLVDLLADQCAVLLEARALAVHASALRAREEAARLKEEFLSAAAHDLRTPLTVVLGQAELLERRQQRNPDAPADAQGLARIAREARRLSDLVTELLDAQRLERGQGVGELVPADLLDVVETVQERYAEGDVRVIVDEPAIALIVSVDRARIEQVLDNLVENALKYTSGGEPPEIRVSTVGRSAEIAVVDHGIGIPEADRPRIFERFFRASNAQSITDTGLGLGLYICRRVVEEHGGEIRFSPTPGGGTTFTVTLPLLTNPGDEAASVHVDARWDAPPAREVVADA